MEPINNQYVFSSPQLLSNGLHSQVLRFNFKLSGSRKASGGPAQECVLKFYASWARIAYEKEVSAYLRLRNTNSDLLYPKAMGCAEWSASKYKKAIGRVPQRITGGGEPRVYVLMLEYISNSTPLSAITMSPSVAKAAIASLCRLHDIRICHGDISTSNALLLEEHEPSRVMWIDFSSSSTLAERKAMALEREKAVEYFGSMVSLIFDLSAKSQNNVRKDDLRRITLRLESGHWPKRRPRDIEPLPQLDETLQFHDWTLMAAGTHARIYRTKQVGIYNSPYFCIKLFRRGWMTPFNLERTAYEYIQAAQIEDYVPQVFGYDSRTLSSWGLPYNPEDDKPYYALVMEWIENAEQMSAENITIDSACTLLTGLGKIHAAGVLHNDTFKRNLLVVREEENGIWTDFSCAQMGVETNFGEEMESAQGIILEMVSTISDFADKTSFMKAGDVGERAK
jgi:tRNA A-37 threonylcarbamoyl transferase component Bud32